MGRIVNGGLSDRDKAILDFEGKWWKYAGAKELAIKEQFGLTGNRYYQVLAALIQRPEAAEYAPVVVNRLRRQVVERQRARDPKRLGIA